MPSQAGAGRTDPSATPPAPPSCGPAVGPRPPAGRRPWRQGRSEPAAGLAGARDGRPTARSTDGGRRTVRVAGPGGWRGRPRRRAGGSPARAAAPAAGASSRPGTSEVASTTPSSTAAPTSRATTAFAGRAAGAGAGPTGGRREGHGSRVAPDGTAAGARRGRAATASAGSTSRQDIACGSPPASAVTRAAASSSRSSGQPSGADRLDQAVAHPGRLAAVGGQHRVGPGGHGEHRRLREVGAQVDRPHAHAVGDGHPLEAHAAQQRVRGGVQGRGQVAAEHRRVLHVRRS